VSRNDKQQKTFEWSHRQRILRDCDLPHVTPEGERLGVRPLTMKAFLTAIDRRGPRCFASLETLARDAGMKVSGKDQGKRHAIRVVKALEALGAICKERRGRSNWYVIVWSQLALYCPQTHVQGEHARAQGEHAIGDKAPPIGDFSARKGDAHTTLSFSGSFPGTLPGASADDEFLVLEEEERIRTVIGADDDDDFPRIVAEMLVTHTLSGEDVNESLRGVMLNAKRSPGGYFRTRLREAVEGFDEVVRKFLSDRRKTAAHPQEEGGKE
jgi:hypothetical protein